MVEREGRRWSTELEPPAWTRPGVLPSRNDAYAVRSLVIVAPVTTRISRISSEVLLGTDDGMPHDCVANLDTITTIPKDYLKSRLTTLSAKKLKEVETAIRFALDMVQSGGKAST